MSHIVPDPESEETPRPKGRGNAILTYETVARIDNRLASLAEMVKGFAEKQTEQQRSIQDHDTRLRALETAQAIAAASASTRKEGWSTTQVVLVTLFGLVNTTAVVGGLIINILRGFK